MNNRYFIPLIAACAILLSSVTAFGREPRAEAVPAIIAVPLANVHDRSAPPGSGLITQVLMGDEVRILEKKDYRYRIAVSAQNHREGWVQQEAVLIPRDSGRHYLDPDREWVVIAVPKAEALILDKTGDHKVSLYAGTRLPVLERNSGSVKVQFPDRSVAIIDADDLAPVVTPDPLLNPASPDDIAATARKFTGVRHKPGGLTAQGMDMPGLIHVVYRVHGYSLGTDTEDLGERAERVTKKELRPGDVLVFRGREPGLHLGNGRFLHSSRKSSVQVAGIHDRRYAGSFQYGLRPAGGNADLSGTPAELKAEEILMLQARTAGLPLGRRISFWAGRFIGTSYDPDPLGLYVRTSRVIADEKVDCMYHVFRSVELAQSSSPAGAFDRALALRFPGQGAVADGLVTNYDRRFQYGEDMVFSGKWGRNVTGDLGKTLTIPGSRGRDQVEILPKQVLQTLSLRKKLRDGDIVFWVKDPKKRVVEEIVAHLSIIHVKSGKPYVIHAAGSKDRAGKPGGGVVKELSFSEYVGGMGFIGAFITRFEE